MFPPMQACLRHSKYGSARGFMAALTFAVGLAACRLDGGGTSPGVAVDDAPPASAGDDSASEPSPSVDADTKGMPDTGADGGHTRREAGVGSDAKAVQHAEKDAAMSVPDASLEPPADSGMENPVPDAASVEEDAGSGCDLDMTLSAEVLFKVNWRGTTLAGIVPVLDGGSGNIRVVVRLDLRGGASSSLRSLVTACDAAMPDFNASWLIGEVYAGLFPPKSWDEPTMPRWDLGWQVPCKEPGCMFSSDQIVATIGARASAQDVWPGRTGPISQIVPVDHDNDGLPAYTIVSANSSEQSASGKPYSEIPVSWTLGARSVTASIAFQLAGQFAGTIDDCETLTGNVMSGRIEARAVACVAQDSPNGGQYTCSADQASFLDENLPNWTVTGGTFRAKRVSPDADCEATRAVWR